MNIKFIFSFIVLLSSSVYNGQYINVQKIDSFLNHIEKNNRGIGSVSIFKEGKEVYSKNFGQSYLRDITYNENTKYQIGSVTKMITATLIFQLIERKKLGLEDKLSKFFDSIPNSHKISIKNLLEHTSGLGDYTRKNDSVFWLINKVSTTQILDEIIAQGILFQPNDTYKYSNSGYFLLTKILEKIYNKNYATIVNEHITKPLKIRNLSSIDSKTENVFPSFEYDTNWKKITDFEFTNVIGVGDIVSTTKDINTFIYHLFQYSILNKESIELMKPNSTNNELFGRGIMMIPFYEHVFYGHGGTTYGTHSISCYNEKDKIGFSLAINGERFPHNDISIGILSIIYDKKYNFPNFNTIELRSEELDSYVGIYSNPKLPLKLTIFKEGNILKAQGTGQPSFVLECYENHKFKLDNIDLKIEFLPYENKLILNQGANKYEMSKDSM